jgi:hypothetical protein
MYTIDEIDETLPEAVKGFLRKGYKLHKIHLDARGKWTHEDLDFENPRIIEAFNRGVRRTEGGTWVLQLGRFTYPIVVEDTGYFVDRLHLADSPTIDLSDGTTEALDPSTLSYESGGRLYCRIKGGDFRARFKRQPYYQIAEVFEERDGEVHFVHGGHDVHIASLEELGDDEGDRGNEQASA